MNSDEPKTPSEIMADRFPLEHGTTAKYKLRDRMIANGVASLKAQAKAGRYRYGGAFADSAVLYDGIIDMALIANAMMGALESEDVV